jgi:Sel1 repeat
MRIFILFLTIFFVSSSSFAASQDEYADNPFLDPLKACFGKNLIKISEAEANTMAQNNDYSFLNPPSICQKRIDQFVDYCSQQGHKKGDCQMAEASLWLAMNPPFAIKMTTRLRHEIRSGDFVPRAAAELGDAKAQFQLGYAYANGMGVPQNYEEAAKWFRRAADQGNAYAQGQLGALYDLGEGVPQNFEEAYFWLVLGAVSGDKATADIRDQTAAHISPEQIIEVQKRVSNWKPTPARAATQ